jgi:hypothetical protein
VSPAAHMHIPVLLTPRPLGPRLTAACSMCCDRSSISAVSVLPCTSLTPPSLLACLQEQDPERKAAMHAIKDTRVDACLYFIPPHRLRKVCAARNAA